MGQNTRRFLALRILLYTLFAVLFLYAWIDVVRNRLFPARNYEHVDVLQYLKIDDGAEEYAVMASCDVKREPRFSFERHTISNIKIQITRAKIEGGSGNSFYREFPGTHCITTSGQPPVWPNYVVHKTIVLPTGRMLVTTDKQIAFRAIRWCEVRLAPVGWGKERIRGGRP
jgi:hypothetical protein